MFRIAWVATLLSCSLAAAEDSSRQDLNRTKETLSREIKRIIVETGIPSITIALLKDDRIVWNEAFGVANVRLKVLATPDTVYSTGSCFKPITSMAVMQLVDAGKLKLDDPINRYLGEHSVNDKSDEGKPVTVRHLLAHYSGLTTKPETEISDGGAELAPLWARVPTRSLSELPALLTATSDPGQTFRYSNYGFAIAGLLVEKVSGQPFEDYVVDHLFTPLGINERPVVPTPEMIERLALPYRLEGNRPVPEHLHQFDIYPAGDLWMSVPAMSTLLLPQLNGGRYNGVEILSEESIAEMRRPQFGGNSGLDFGLRDHDGSTLIMHGGGVPGYSTKFILDVDSKVGVYVAANSTRQSVAVRLLAQMSIDLLRGMELGKGLVRDLTGIGVVFGRTDSGQWRIDGTIPGSSANRAKLERGQIIRSINEVKIEGKSFVEIIPIMTGPAGTKVSLGLIDSLERPTTIELTKEKCFVPG